MTSATRPVSFALAACALIALSGCGTTPPTSTSPQDAGSPAGGGDAGAATDGGVTEEDAGTAGEDGGGGDDEDAGTHATDGDGDGLEDAFEAQVAQSYLPFLSLDLDDGCPLGGILYRVRKHPNDPALLHVLMVHLYEEDCGATSHVGDDELFAFTVDPAKSAPEGVTALIAISHQGTVCEETTRCGLCNGLSACEVAPDGRPVVYASKGKHAQYVKRSACNVGFCLDYCAAVAATSQQPPLVNAGEPGAPLVTNLTAQGFITTANGWTEPELFDFNPWQPGKEFGGAGVVADDLMDPAAETEPCKAE